MGAINLRKCASVVISAPIECMLYVLFPCFVLIKS